MARQVIIGLDLIRFSAAILVGFFHLSFSLTVFRYPELRPVAAHGWVGVEIFFVLSGFVICYTAGASPAKFLKSRIARLVPGMLIAATICGAVLWMEGRGLGDVALRWLKSVSFLPFVDIIDGAYWTLPYEVSFYAMVWLLLVSGRRERLETLLTGIGLLTLTYYGARIGRKLVGGPMALPFDGWIRFADVVGMIRFGCYFGLGGLLYLLLIDRVTVRRLCFAGLFTVLGAIFIFELGPTYNHGASPRIIAMLIWLVALGAMLLSVLCNDRLARWISGRVTRLLGLATYPFYLLHSTLGAAMMTQWAALGMGRWPALLITMVLICGLAMIVSLVLEPPLARGIIALLQGVRGMMRQARAVVRRRLVAE